MSVKIQSPAITVVLAGGGKLAQELHAGLGADPAFAVRRWQEMDPPATPDASVIVHAGSGRELPAITAHCRATGTPLIELATGTDAALGEVDFPLVVCPNTNILMLKFMLMLERSGHLFANEPRRLMESHQADKTSTPGTAVNMARSLGMAPGEITSVRQPATQQHKLGIPAEHLGRHAWHRITIGEGDTRITMETKVLGPTPYVDGVARIIQAVIAHQPLERRRHEVLAFVEQGWI